MPVVSLQKLNGQAYILRLHPEGGFGDAYTWVCTVEREGATAIIHGAIAAPGYRRLFAEPLKAEGFTKVRWYRVGKGWLEWEI